MSEQTYWHKKAKHISLLFYTHVVWQTIDLVHMQIMH